MASGCRSCAAWRSGDAYVRQFRSAALPNNVTVRETMRVNYLKVPYRLAGQDRTIAFHDWLVSRALAQSRDRIELVHCWPRAALLTLKKALVLGISTVLERPNAHTGFAYEAVARECASLSLTMPAIHSHRFDARRLAKEEAEYELADRLACPSEFVADTFRSRGFGEAKLALHQYGYDPAAFPTPNSPRASSNGPLSACFAGSCEPRKGLHFALRMAGFGRSQARRKVLHLWAIYAALSRGTRPTSVASGHRRCRIHE